jgi:nitrogen regulatory protein P-II 2
MQTHSRKLLVVICEAALEKALVADVGRLGAAGYTIVDARGGGRGGTRDATWESDRSIEIKVICDADVADRVAAHVLAAYSAHYAVTLYLADVSVLRPEKF